MPDTPTAAVTRLTAVLERENAALAAMNLPAATALLAEKTAALTALRDMPALSSGPEHEAPFRRLASLAADNHALLERAMTAQQRVIGIIAHAAALAMEEPAYGARRRVPRVSDPIALATRA